ncbi:MAG: hypothetical protein U9M94_01315 [Patescibacteria group bacterium]|nr:hypothetical protein [Patescibacteria group bacterium]
MNKKENFIKPQETTPNVPEINQEEIDKELSSRAMRIDETTEEYQAEQNKQLEMKKSKQEKQDNKEIADTANEINKISSTELCKKDLLYHLESPNIDWNGVEGRICAMLSEIQKEERSEKTLEINGKVAEYIAGWLKQNVDKYDNQTLASEAIKHASAQAENNYAQLGNENEKLKEEEYKSTASGVKDMFEGTIDGAKEGVNKKTIEYDKRIREMIANDPDNPRLNGALKDFKQWTKKDWTEDFSVE